MSSENRAGKSADLVREAISGSQEAMTELYGISYNAVYNTVRFLIRDEDTAQDILQDSYIKAFRSLDQLREADSFTAWVKSIAHNRAVDYLRKNTPVTLSTMTLGEGEEEIELEDERPENLPEVSLDRKETARLLGEILDSLPQEQLACISLFYYDQLSVKEIAELLDIPEATVKSRLQYGRKKIESQVKALEKKGTKLYGLAPILFLLLLMRSQDAMAAEIPADLSGVVLPEKISKAGCGGAGSAGSGAAGGTIGKAGAGAAFQFGSVVGIRIIAAVLAAAILLGTGAVLLHRSGSQSDRPEQRPVPEEFVLPAPPQEPTVELEPEPVPEPEPEYRLGYLYAENTAGDHYTKELSGDTLYIKLPELTVGLPASWRGKFGIHLSGTYHANQDGTTGEFSHSGISFFLLPDKYQGEEDPPFISLPDSYLFQVNCILRDMDDYMKKVVHYSHPEHYVPIGSGKLGNYVMIIEGDLPPEFREEGYNWELFDEMAQDMDYIIAHTYVTPLEEDPDFVD